MEIGCQKITHVWVATIVENGSIIGHVSRSKPTHKSYATSTSATQGLTSEAPSTQAPTSQGTTTQATDEIKNFIFW